MNGVEAYVSDTSTGEVLPVSTVHCDQCDQLSRPSRLRAIDVTAVPLAPEAPLAQPTPMLRSSAMLLMNEDLARARMREMERFAEDHRRANRLLAVRRSQRRANEVARRARLSRP